MSKKIIPQSLRLDKLKNWNSSWVGEKQDYSKVFFFDYNLRKYLNKFCKRKKIELNNISIEKKGNYLNIYLFIHKIPIIRKKKLKKKYQTPTQLKIFTNKLEEVLKNICIDLNLYFIPKIHFINYNCKTKKIRQFFFKKNKKDNNIKLPKFIYYFKTLSFVGFYTQSASLINDFLIKNLQKNLRHKQFLKNMDKILKKNVKLFNNCLGYKLEFKGRINGIARSRKIIFKEGKNPFNTLKYNIKYDLKEVQTPYGICSLKLWLFYK